jgi:hypothetical protein
MRKRLDTHVCIRNEGLNVYFPRITFSARLSRSLSAAICISGLASKRTASQCNGASMASRHGTPQTGCAVGKRALYVRYSACHLASFDVLAARRIRRRTGDSVLLGYRHRRSHHHLEDGAAREIAMLKRLGLFEQVAFWVIGAGLPRNSLSHQGAAFLKWAIAASRGFTRSLRPPVRAKLPGFRCPEPWRPCC